MGRCAVVKERRCRRSGAERFSEEMSESRMHTDCRISQSLPPKVSLSSVSSFQRMSESASQRVSESANRRMNESANGRIGEGMSEPHLLQVRGHLGAERRYKRGAVSQQQVAAHCVEQLEAVPATVCRCVYQCSGGRVTLLPSRPTGHSDRAWRWPRTYFSSSWPRSSRSANACCRSSGVAV